MTRGRAGAGAHPGGSGRAPGHAGGQAGARERAGARASTGADDAPEQAFDLDIEAGELLLGVLLPGVPVPHAYALGGSKAFRRIADAPAYRTWKRDHVRRLRTWAESNGVARLARPVVADVSTLLPRPSRPHKAVSVAGNGIALEWPWGSGRFPSLASGDADNFCKGAVDTCVQAGLLLDDRLVVEARARKQYARIGEEPGVEVRFYAVRVTRGG